MSIGEALREAQRRLAAVSESPRLDAELLLAELIGAGRAALLTREPQPLDAGVAVQFEALLRRRENGEPIAYLLGRQGFWTLDLQIAAGVLIPRPDTERLVEWALHIAAERPAQQAPDRLRVADLGTGSGAIALALARELPQAEVVATDRSGRALDLAASNARAHALGNVRFARGCWFEALQGGDRSRFDLILSNPPYIAAGDPHLPALRHEPAEALVAGAEGLDDLRRIIGAAPEWLAPGGWLLVEHGHDQGAAVRALFRAAGFEGVETRRDFGGRERVTGGRRA